MKKLLLLLFSLALLLSAQPNTASLGHSTYNCLDVDGDGYGVGPGCAGADADDNDATVHSASDVITKYGSLAAFWTHMGWTPTAVMYVDGGAGSCSAVSTPFVYSALTACASIDAAITAMSAGQAVVTRTGTYARVAEIGLKPGTLSGSTCSAYNYYLSYPGELPDFEYDSSVDGMGVTGSQSCFVVDGLKLYQACLANATCGGGGYGITNSHLVYGMTYSHMNVGGFTDNVFIQYNQMGTQVVHNYIHDAYAGGDFGHGIYLGSNVTSSSGTTIQGNIITNAMQACIHANGPMTDILVDSNLIYGCNQSILFQSGISHSIVQNNSVHTSATPAFELNTYANSYSTQTWQCHDENYNLIVNNTLFQDAQSFNPSLVTDEDAGHAAIYVVDDGTCQTQAGYTPDLGHNTYLNNIIVHNCGTQCVDYKGPALRYLGADAGTYLTTDTYTNNLIDNFDSAGRIIDPLGTETYQNCSWFTSASNVPLGSGNICGSDPLFSAANPQWNLLPFNWNLSVTVGSPAIKSGSHSLAPVYDLGGSARTDPPTIGAYDVPVGYTPTSITWTKYPSPSPITSCSDIGTPPCYWALNQGFGTIKPDGVNGGAFVYADRQTQNGTVSVSGGTNVSLVSGDQFGPTWGLAAGDTLKINGTSFTITQGSVTSTALTITSSSSDGTFAYTAGGGGSGALVSSTDVYNWQTTTHKFTLFPGGNGTLAQASAAIETDDPALTWPADRQQDTQQFYDSSRGAEWLTGGVNSTHFWDCMSPSGVICATGRHNTVWKMDLTAKTWTSLSPTHQPVGAASGQGSAIDTDDQIIMQAGYSGDIGFRTAIYCPTDLNQTPGTLTANQTTAGCIQTGGVDDWCAFSTSGQGCSSTASGITMPFVIGPQNYYSHATGKFYLFMGQLVSGAVNGHVYSYAPLTKTWAQADTGTGCPMQTPAGTWTGVWIPGVTQLSNGKFLYHYFAPVGGTTSDWVFDPSASSCTQITTIGTGPMSTSGSSGGSTLAQDSLTGTIVSWYQGGMDNGVWEGALSESLTSGSTLSGAAIISGVIQ